MKHPTASTLIAAFALAALPAQGDPRPAPAAAVQLTYELPVDALQRTLRDTPDEDLEQLLKRSVDVIQRRVGRAGTVHRTEATRFTVTVQRPDEKQLTRLKRRIRTLGSLEMRIVAEPDFDLDVAAEREHLLRWLDAGGRDKVHADPRAIDAFEAKDRARIRWVARRIEPNGRRWPYALFQVPQFQSAIVRLFDDDAWNHGAVTKDSPPYLIELIALDLAAGGFTHDDLDQEETRVQIGAGNRPGILYELRQERAKAYSTWTGDHVGRGTALVFDGMLLTAPILRSRIPGRGVIEASFDREAAEDLCFALRCGALPAAPRLIAEKAEK